MNYDNLKAELALIEAANMAVSDTLSKPRAPLLANLLPCERCGHESSFEKIGRGLCCTGCGTALDAERMRGPVPTPPFPPPSRDAALADHGQSAVAEADSTSMLRGCPPGSGVDPQRPHVRRDEAANATIAEATEAKAARPGPGRTECQGTPLPTDPHPTPSAASLSAPDVASSHGASGNRSDLPFRYADPQWGDVRPGSDE